MKSSFQCLNVKYGKRMIIRIKGAWSQFWLKFSFSIFIVYNALEVHFM